MPQIQEPWLAEPLQKFALVWRNAGMWGDKVSEISCQEGLPTSLSREGQSIMSKLIVLNIKNPLFANNFESRWAFLTNVLT